jgi:EAL domain-containing protein (putative c-di-GMP-specific phosphodiesterase class I)/GGDEF domain-containing protein
MKDQRKQPRLEVSQSARMILDSGREIICDIADFCLGGLFLKFAIPERDREWVKGHEGKTLHISFSTPATLGAQAYDFSARLVRQSESGVGVAFDETPVAAVLALNKVAAALRSQKTNVKLYGGIDLHELRNVCKGHLKQAVEEGFAKFGELVIPRLEGAAATARSIAEEQELRDALGLIRPVLGDAQYRCLNEMLGRLGSLGLGRSRDEPVNADLSIVEKDEFEDWLSLTAISNRLGDRFSGELPFVQLRLEKLYGVGLDSKNSPFSPAAIVKAMNQAFADMALSQSTRQIVYATLHDALSEPLEKLYRTLLEVMPEVEADKKLVAPVVKPSPPSSGMPKEELLSAVGGANSPHEPASDPLGKLYRALLDVVPEAEAERKPAYPLAGSTSSSPGMHTAEPVSFESMANSLLAHARQGRASQTADTELPARSLNIVQELIASGKIPAARQAEARVSANVFNELINAVRMEKSLPAEVVPQFMQLESALLRQALLDPSYLNNAVHPAHAALNAMDKLSLLSSDDGRIVDERILKHISGWVERMRNEADENPAIFESVRAQIEKLLQPLMKERSTRIANLQAALEGWQKTGQAIHMVMEKLEQRVAGKKVPAVVLDLFTTGWRNYLIRVMLRKGGDSPEEAEAWEVIDKLLGWLNPEQSGEPSYQDIQALLQAVDSNLKLVCADKDAQDKLVERLTNMLLQDREVSYRAVTTILPAQPQHVDAPAGKDGEDNPLDSFRVGDWVSFPDMPVPLNLIWIGDDPESYVFCNYRGVKKLELNREEFVQRVNSGEAKLADNLDLPLMERSFNSMIQRIHQDLLKQAMIDEKTGLIERREFLRRARGWLLNSGNAEPGDTTRNLVMGVLDIESMRLFRSRLGTEGCTEMMRSLAAHLQKIIDSGLLTHSTEYTFAFLMPVDDPAQIQSVGESIISDISHFSFKRGADTFTLSANLGLANADGFVNPEDLYNKADEACVEAKHLGRNQVVVRLSEEAGHNGYLWLTSWSSRFTELLEGDRLFLRCQPIVATTGESAEISHYEILLGANAETQDPINIGEMVAAVEQLRRASDIDQWVIRTVFRWMRENPEKLGKIKGLSINLSGQSINSRNFLDFLGAELAQGSIPGDKLIFEITESAAIDSFVQAERFIHQVRRYGCRFALDDFGVGFSSYSYLKNLKVNYLKIDGSFVRNMSENEVDVALVSSMHETSRFLGIKTIAEVVENQETLDILKRIGVDYVQGYYTGKPMPIEQLAA